MSQSIVLRDVFFPTSAQLRIGEMRAVPGNWWVGLVRSSDCGRVSAKTRPQFERLAAKLFIASIAVDQSI